MLTLIEPDDKVVSIIPTYQQHYSIPKSFGGHVNILYLKEENNWLPDLEELERLVGTDTKIICMNNPNNPTGAVIPEEMLNKIIDIAKNLMPIFFVMKYIEDLNHEEILLRFRLQIFMIKVFQQAVHQKSFSLAGLRLGWIAANEDIITQINNQREYNTISVGILDDFCKSCN